MGWPASLLVGVLTALAAALLAGIVANLAVGWYRISSFEGASAYFVVGLALVGLVIGFAIGVSTARVVAGWAEPGFLKALGLAFSVTIGITLAIGATARLQADVPPRIDGQTQLLHVEFRWPEGQHPTAASESSAHFVRLSATSGRQVRVSHEGPLWLEDARLEDGFWVVPGAVEVFTSRGRRLIDITPQGLVPGGFMVPLPGRPGEKYLQWSDWLPNHTAGQVDHTAGFRYRFRVVPRNRPIRGETYGPFEVRTIADGFSSSSGSDGRPVWTAEARFEILHRGQPVTVEYPPGSGSQPVKAGRVDAVAVIGSQPALLVLVNDRWDGGQVCLLVVDPSGAVRTVPLARSTGGLRGAPVTNDSATFAASRDEAPLQGHFDRRSFVHPGLYLFDGAVLDTRDLSIRPFTPDHHHQLIDRIPPLGGSPDGKSLVRLGYEEGTVFPALFVFELGRDTSYVVPIDHVNMRYAQVEQIDPDWVNHHFAWERGPEGRDRLAERPRFDPLAWRGTLTTDTDGYREYRLSPAGEPLREAVLDFLESEFGGQVMPPQEYEYGRRIRVGDAIVYVAWNEGSRHVGLWMDRGTDTVLVTEIAARFDATLRTGKFDHFFGR